MEEILQPSDALVERLAQIESTTRDFLIAEQPLPPAESIAVPSDFVLQEWLTDHASRFSFMEMRGFDLLWVDRDVFSDTQGETIVPERRSFVQIFVPDRENADRILARVSTVEELQNESQALTRSNLTRAGIGDTVLANLVFSLSEGQISSPIESSLGWYVVGVLAIQQGSSEELRARVAEAADRVAETLVQMEDLVISGADFEEIAETIPSATVRRFEPVSANGVTSAGIFPEDLPEPHRVLPVVFQTLEGAHSEVIETTDGAGFIVRVNAVSAPRLPPLERKYAPASQPTGPKPSAEKKALAAIETRLGGSADGESRTETIESTEESFLALFPLARKFQNIRRDDERFSLRFAGGALCRNRGHAGGAPS